MFRNNDDDFDFDIDDVVKIDSTGIQPSLSALSSCNKNSVPESKSPVNVSISSQIRSQQSVGDWGSDDDVDESDFLNVESPKDERNNIQSPPSISQKCNEERKNVDDSKFIEADIDLKNPNDNHKSYGDLSRSSSKENVEEPQIRKFPGPAGFLFPPCNTSDSKSKGQMQKRRSIILEDDMHGLFAWEEMLKTLNLSKSLNNKKINIQAIKRKYASGALYLIAPILVVGIKNIQFTQGDALCVFQDPTGEANGSIHQHVVEEHGKLLKMGSILLLRKPTILMSGPVNFLVTVTKTCLFGIYSPHEGTQSKMIKCHQFEKTELQDWLSERIVSGEPLSTENDAATSSPAPTLFSGGARSSPYPSPYSNNNQHRTGIPNNFKQVTTPVSKSAPSNVRLNQVNNWQPSNPSPKPTWKPNIPTNSSSTINNFQMRTPTSSSSSSSKTVSFSNATNSPKSTSSVSAKTAEPVESDDQFLSQFLEGVDTDSLFDDF